MMRTAAFVITFFVSTAGLAAAQEWAEFQSIRDGFTVTFPGQPTVKDATWKSQQNYVLPARQYTADRGRAHYSITVVDYRGIERMAQERVKTCPAGAPLCVGTALGGFGMWKHDVREAPLFATMQFLQRDAKLTDLSWSQHDMVVGQELQMLNTDQSRTYGYVAMHDMRLYILEATIPAGDPPATLFQSSMSWVDASGSGIRYQTMYSNEFHGLGVYPVPARAPAAVGAPAAAPPERGGNAGAR